MADIVDLSSVTSSLVKRIDFRAFASLWCGLNVASTCFGSLCCAISEVGSPTYSNSCRALSSALQGNIGYCIHAFEEVCRMTVWMYQQGNNEMLDNFQPDKELQKKKKKISYVRKRRDLYKALGLNSNAEKATILAFGSLFSSPYKAPSSTLIPMKHQETLGYSH